MNPQCDCSKGMEYHALNCPVSPGQPQCNCSKGMKYHALNCPRLPGKER
jgi:hypothetical protein